MTYKISPSKIHELVKSGKLKLKLTDEGAAEGHLDDDIVESIQLLAAAADGYDRDFDRGRQGYDRDFDRTNGNPNS